MDFTHDRANESESLEYPAATGNDEAMDRLADLAYGRHDLGQLLSMLEDGYERAGQLMTQLALANKDAIRLQELSDMDVPEAQEALDSLLAGP